MALCVALSSAIVPESQRKEETRIRYNVNTCSRTILSACSQIHPKTTRSLQPLLIDVFRGTGSVGWDAKEEVVFPENFSNLRMKQLTGGFLDHGSTQTNLSVLFLQ